MILIRTMRNRMHKPDDFDDFEDFEGGDDTQPALAQDEPSVGKWRRRLSNLPQSSCPVHLAT